MRKITVEVLRSEFFCTTRLVGYMFTMYSVWFEWEMIENLEDREDS